MDHQSKIYPFPCSFGGADPSYARERRCRVAEGITTYNREDYYRECARSVAEHLSGLAGAVYVHDDGSDEGSFEIHQQITQMELAGRFSRVVACGEHEGRNRGVAYSKNRLL
jgi:glycosyltransferase involved in cell wall biosynthesis